MKFRDLFSPEIADSAGKIRDRYTRSEISKYISHILFSIILGLLAGSAGILFHTLLEGMRRIFEFGMLKEHIPAGIGMIVVVPVIGGIAVAWMTRRFPHLAKERDVVSVIKAVMIKGGFIPLKNTVFHLIAPIISIGSGAPLGPEGPAAKIGSGVGSFMAQVFRMEQRDMKMYTAAGAGAAIAAVFNAPIAGVFFGIEVILLNDLKNQALSALIISSVVADILSRAALGARHVFMIPSYTTGNISEFPWFLVLGVLCGMVSLCYFWLRRFFAGILNRRLKIRNEFLRLVPVTVVFGFTLIHFNQLYGIGYSTINDVMNLQLALNAVLALLVLKLIFMSMFLEAGSYGGTFAPALMVGVLLGYAAASSANILFGVHLDPVAFALISMGGVLAGMNSIPLTSIMLVFEVTNDYRFILPLMFVSIVSYLSVVYVNRGSLYTLELLRDGIDVTKRGGIDILGKIKVRDLKRSDYDTVTHRTPFNTLLQALYDSRYGDIFVMDDRNRLLGVVSLKEIRQTLGSAELVDLLIAGDITIPVPVVTEDEPVSSAIRKIQEYHIENIPVVSSADHRKITGMLTHQDILSAYNRLLEAWETDQFLIDYKFKK